MSLPDVVVSVVDPGMGFSTGTSKTQVKIGVSSSGLQNSAVVVYSPSQARSAFGVGPLVDALVRLLEGPGGPVVAVRTTRSSGRITAVTRANGSAGPLVTLSGIATNDYSLAVQITKTGDIAAGRFRLSYDGGITWQADALISQEYPIADLGVTITFPPGAYVAVGTDGVYGETYTFQVYVGAAFAAGATDVANALDAAKLSSLPWGLVHVVGSIDPTAAASATETIAAAVQTKLAAFYVVNSIFARGVVDCANDADADILAAFDGKNHDRVAVAAATVWIQDPVKGQIQRPFGHVLMAMLGAKPPGLDAGQVRLFRGYSAALPTDIASIASADTVGLDAARFSVPRTILGKGGYWVTRCPLFGSATSDYKLLQYGQVIDEVCRAVRGVLLERLNSGVLLAKNGTIDPGEAFAIEQVCNRAGDDAVVGTGDATAVSTLVDRSAVIATGAALSVQVGVQPLGYLSRILATVSLVAKLPEVA